MCVGIEIYHFYSAVQYYEILTSVCVLCNNNTGAFGFRNQYGILFITNKFLDLQALKIWSQCIKLKKNLSKILYWQWL